MKGLNQGAWYKRRLLLSKALHILVRATIFFALAQQASAREVVLLTDDLAILRDFARITISSQAASQARAYFDADQFVVKGLAPTENSELRQKILDALSVRLQVAKEKSKADYLVQVRMGARTDFAIRNPKNVPSHGYVMISLCKFPIRVVADDCENLQYDYFRDYDAKEIFAIVFRKWLETTFVSD